MKNIKYMFLLAAVLMLAGCGEEQQNDAPEATPTKAIEATVPPTATPTPEPTATPKPTATPIPFKINLTNNHTNNDYW